MRTTHIAIVIISGEIINRTLINSVDLNKCLYIVIYNSCMTIEVHYCSYVMFIFFYFQTTVSLLKLCHVL